MPSDKTRIAAALLVYVALLKKKKELQHRTQRKRRAPARRALRCRSITKNVSNDVQAGPSKQQKSNSIQEPSSNNIKDKQDANHVYSTISEEELGEDEQHYKLEIEDDTSICFSSDSDEELQEEEDSQEFEEEAAVDYKQIFIKTEPNNMDLDPLIEENEQTDKISHFEAIDAFNTVIDWSVQNHIDEDDIMTLKNLRESAEGLEVSSNL